MATGPATRGSERSKPEISGVAAQTLYLDSMDGPNGIEERRAALECAAQRTFGYVRALRVKEAAECLSCSVSQVYSLLESGRLRAIRLGDGSRAGKRVCVLSLINFLENGGVEAGASNRVAELEAKARSKQSPSAALL